jgi:hypothetical protein
MRISIMVKFNRNFIPVKVYNDLSKYVYVHFNVNGTSVIIQYTIKKLKEIKRFTVDSVVGSIYVNSNYLFASHGTNIIAWDVETGAIIRNFNTSLGRIQVVYERNGTLFAGVGNRVLQWSISDPSRLVNSTTFPAVVKDIHVTGAGKLYVICEHEIVDGIVYNYTLNTESSSKRLSEKAEYFIHDPHRVVVKTSRNIYIHDVGNFFLYADIKAVIVPQSDKYVLFADNNIYPKRIHGIKLEDGALTHPTKYYGSKHEIIDFTYMHSQRTLIIIHKHEIEERIISVPQVPQSHVIETETGTEPRTITETSTSSQPRSRRHNVVNYEEDSDVYDDIVTNNSHITLESNPSHCSNDNLITLEPYTDEDNVIFIYVQSSSGIFEKAVCSTKEEYVAYLNSNKNTSIPDNIMTIYTKPRDYKDTLGFGTSPTGKIVVKLPVNNMYVTFGSMKRLLHSDNNVWYAMPLFGGKRRRVGNIKGLFGPSMNHGQIPGFKIYKLYTNIEIEQKVTVKETNLDYPSMFAINHAEKLYNLLGESQIKITFVNSLIDELVRVQTPNVTTLNLDP